MNYKVAITVQALVDESDLHIIDQEEGPGMFKVHHYDVTMSKTHTMEDVIERALDDFHDEIPIKVLDDYNITARVIMDYSLLMEQRNALLELLWDDEENILWGIVYLLDDLLDKQWEAGIIREELVYDALQDAAAEHEEPMEEQ